MTVDLPPDHVLAAFGLTGLRPVPLGSSWEGGWRCGEVVLSMVADHARAAWSAKVRETLFVDGVRLARPVRSTDGRYVVAGWRADTFVTGTPEPRHDEVVSAAVRLHEATAKLERPRFLTQPPRCAVVRRRRLHRRRPRGVGGPAAALAAARARRWRRARADGQRSVELINQLAALRRPTRSPSQLVHGDLYGTVLFAGTAAPGITDITPYWRPASWAAGVVVVDALAWGEADDGLVERWASAAGVAADVVARLDVPVGGPRPASAFDGGGVPRPGPHRRAGPADPLPQNSWRTSRSGTRPSSPAPLRRGAVPAAGWPGAARAGPTR